MGRLENGVWIDQWHNTKETKGRYVRKPSIFRNWITVDGEAGPTGKGGYLAEKDRYHLYISWACPWAHRTLIFRAIKGLENMISISGVNAIMRSKGWTFDDGYGVIPDNINHSKYLYEVYLKEDNTYSGRVTVPLLWDKKTSTIVNNESADIIRMFNSAFDNIGAKEGDYYPDSLRDKIDNMNDFIYQNINNGVYRSGFATTQDAYDEAIETLFLGLDELDNILSKQRYLVGNIITEADWRLLPTLLRFDSVYHGHFKCNKRKLKEYDNLFNYTKELYQFPGISNTYDDKYSKEHYYGSHETINPSGVIAHGPEFEFDTPHNRV
ncbi:MAG: glutathione S-transferase family protein [Alphaproteobacteria bacterium]|nr:glutathione S-transferase family protein [Alphaproteobacteria bacterium]